MRVEIFGTIIFTAESVARVVSFLEKWKHGRVVDEENQRNL